MAHTWSDTARFLSEVKSSFQTVGALVPSSHWVGQAFAKPTRRHTSTPGSRPVRILELGSGTGPLTSEVVKVMRPEDTLDAVEMSEKFADILRRRFATEPHFQRVAANSRVHAINFLEMEIEQPYDFIVCSLPFNNFPPELIRSIFRKMHGCLAPGGTLTFFEYLAIRHFRGLVSSPSGRARLSRVARILGHYLERYEYERDVIWLNLTPAVAHHLSARGTERKGSKWNGARVRV
jgi:phospholipid N-methyltransferase